ncbi:MAG: TerC family protein [Proteobacteria bacterium]|nr:MAG: TerC family protein [Pseudomonadota bacterium]
MLFPFSEYYWFYGAFVLFVLFMLSLDLGVFNRKAHVITPKEAIGWSAFWISLALLFNFGFYQFAWWKFAGNPELLALAGKSAEELARQVGLEFLTGFVVEKALAVDNIFVFVVVFNYFGIPALYQHRVLFYGVLGALVFRAIFIALGALLMQYQAVVLLFGAFLIFTGVKMIFAPEKPVDPEKNFLIGLVRRFIPITNKLEGGKFVVKQGGRFVGTPLLVALVFMEFSDIVFAVDSVPAIFAVTKEPLIVFTSNIFAILGLRSLYFLLAGMVSRFHYLKYGLAAVLIFVGLKMTWLNEVYDGHFPIGLSLGIIFGCILLSVLYSLWKVPPQEP